MKRRDAIAVAAVIVLALLALFFYAGMCYEAWRSSAPGPLATYASVIGIAFQYPASAGHIEEEVHERGMCPRALPSKADGCDHRYFAFVEPDGSDLWFMSAESLLFTKYPTPREGRYEDTLSHGDVESYCTWGPNPPISCTTRTNAYGLRVVKAGYLPACNGFEACGGQAFYLYFVETGDPSYPVVALWYDRADTVVSDAAVDEVVQTLHAASATSTL